MRSPEYGSMIFVLEVERVRVCSYTLRGGAGTINISDVSGFGTIGCFWLIIVFTMGMVYGGTRRGRGGMGFI